MRTFLGLTFNSQLRYSSTSHALATIWLVRMVAHQFSLDRLRQRPRSNSPENDHQYVYPPSHKDCPSCNLATKNDTQTIH